MLPQFTKTRKLVQHSHDLLKLANKLVRDTI